MVNTAPAPTTDPVGSDVPDLTRPRPETTTVKDTPGYTVFRVTGSSLW
ncbi:hypothetical protein [Promicromonospora sp. NPDC050262]